MKHYVKSTMLKRFFTCRQAAWESKTDFRQETLGRFRQAIFSNEVNKLADLVFYQEAECRKPKEWWQVKHIKERYNGQYIRL